ncbi:hypothetical protein B7494_g262 [Chlorociboria aeruginascens]|nr:hypothetical protein B7494_g262 [Chlorociboria aeruginascens]
MSQSPKIKAKHLREPPPSLFLGPQSQNASQLSLANPPSAPPQNTSSTLSPSARAPLIRQRSQRLQRNNADGSAESTVAPTIPRNPIPRLASEGQKQAARTDALWAEMQSTLEEVELSAVNGTHVFGTEHSKALEGLRAAQIALAQAWARSEADDVMEGKEDGSKRAGTGLLGSDGKSVLDADETGKGSTVQSGSGRAGSVGGTAPGGGTEKTGANLEDETQSDILLARKRREANDKYFQRINEGVLDVVAKLEEVAVAMRAVELETRDIWGENETDPSLSVHD